MRFGSWVLRSLHERASGIVSYCDAAHVNNTEQPPNTSSTCNKTHKQKKNKTPTWNNNWDHCENQSNGKAIHQIVLIRHGQYNQGPGGDEVHTLTPLGHIQAHKTGQRLVDLMEKGKIYQPRRIYYSTQVRATETWLDIRSKLPATLLPLEHNIRPCSMIREGAVCKPIPPSSNWKVEEIDFIRDQPRVGAI